MAEELKRLTHGGAEGGVKRYPPLSSCLLASEVFFMLAEKFLHNLLLC